jgi:hypothetical protein
MEVKRNFVFRLGWSSGRATRTAIGTVGKDPVVVIGIDARPSGGPGACVVVNITTVDRYDTTSSVDAIAAVVVDGRIADPGNSDGAAVVIGEDTVGGIAREIATIGSHARVLFRVQAIGTASEGTIRESSFHLTGSCLNLHGVERIVPNYRVTDIELANRAGIRIPIDAVPSGKPEDDTIFYVHSFGHIVDDTDSVYAVTESIYGYASNSDDICSGHIDDDAIDE